MSEIQLMTTSTDQVTQPKRSRYWLEMIERHYVGVELKLSDPDGFCGKITSARLPGLEMTRYQALANSAARSRRHAAEDGIADFFLFIPRLGMMSFQQFGRECLVRPGDMCLIDGGEPFALEQPERVDFRVLRIKRAQLESRLSHPSSAAVRSVKATTGLAAFAVTYGESLWRELPGAVRDRTPFDLLVPHLIDLVARSLDVDTENDFTISPAKAAIYRRARDLIAERLSETGLNAETLAAELGISTRYLHAVFSSYGSSVGASILRERLRQARQAVAHPSSTAAPLSSIAHGLGFASPAHFSVSFKREFGVSPSQLRSETKKQT